MPKMAYFKSSQLIGRVLRRPSAPSLRGNVRRKNPDGTRQAPYFAGLPAGGGTFAVQSKFDNVSPIGTVSATITADPAGTVLLSDVLTQLNSQLAPVKVVAVDDGGCIGLVSSATNPADAWIKVFGGTAAAALGFDLNVQPFFAGPYDLKSAPEAKLQNPFGAAAPAPGEDFDSATVARALARVAQNMDVLFSEIAKEEVVIAKIGSVTGPTSGAYIDVEALAPGTKVFTGGTPLANKVLSSSSAPEEVGRFFFLIDQATKLLAKGRVIGVTDSSNANLLGVERAIIASSGISAIPAGDVLKLSTSTNGVTAGDYVKVAGANNGQWRNNGYRWVVEEVLPDLASLRVRPMSKMELALVGETIDEAQPVVELCATLSPGETYGTASVYRGPFSTNARLKLSMTVPVGSTYDIYAAVPASQRERLPDSLMTGMTAAMAHLTSTNSTQNWEILWAPSITATAGGYTWSGFPVRYRDRFIWIPAGSRSPVDTYLYIDWASCTVQTSQTHPYATTYAELLATYRGGVLQTCARVIDGRHRQLTVSQAGMQANFTSIEAAMRWAYEEGQYRTGENKYEIVVYGDYYVSAQIQLLAGTHIRGATEDCTLISMPGFTSPLFVIPTTGTSSVRDIKTRLNAGQSLAALSNTVGRYLAFINVVEERVSDGHWYRHFYKDWGWDIYSATDASGGGNAILHIESPTTEPMLMAANLTLSGKLVSPRAVVTTIEGPDSGSYSVSATILEVNGDNIRVSPAEAATLRIGDDLVSMQNASDHGTVGSIDLNTGWLGIDVGGLWQSWVIGDTVTATRNDGAIGTKLLGGQNGVNGPVIVGVKGLPKTDATPILRVSNDSTGAAPAFDVTKDGVVVGDSANILSKTKFDLLIGGHANKADTLHSHLAAQLEATPSALLTALTVQGQLDELAYGLDTVFDRLWVDTPLPAVPPTVSPTAGQITDYAIGNAFVSDSVILFGSVKVFTGGTTQTNVSLDTVVWESTDGGTNWSGSKIAIPSGVQTSLQSTYWPGGAAAVPAGARWAHGMVGIVKANGVYYVLVRSSMFDDAGNGGWDLFGHQTYNLFSMSSLGGTWAFERTLNAAVLYEGITTLGSIHYGGGDVITQLVESSGGNWYLKIAHKGTTSASWVVMSSVDSAPTATEFMRPGARGWTGTFPNGDVVMGYARDLTSNMFGYTATRAVVRRNGSPAWSVLTLSDPLIGYASELAGPDPTDGTFLAYSTTRHLFRLASDGTVTDLGQMPWSAEVCPPGMFVKVWTNGARYYVFAHYYSNHNYYASSTTRNVVLVGGSPNSLMKAIDRGEIVHEDNWHPLNTVVIRLSTGRMIMVGANLLCARTYT